MKSAEITKCLKFKAWLYRNKRGSFYWAVNMLLKGKVCTSNGWWCKSVIFIGCITRKKDGKQFIGITKEEHIYDFFVGYRMTPLDESELRVFPTMNDWIISEAKGTSLIK